MGCERMFKPMHLLPFQAENSVEYQWKCWKRSGFATAVSEKG